jgi:DNA topoisomerase IA
VDFLEGRYKDHFMNLEYTQKMEKCLDDIAEGKVKWDTSVRDFIQSFPLK